MRHREMQALSPDECLRLLDAAKGGSLYIPVALCIFAGLRRGEVFGLRWTDLDLPAGTLTVRQTLDYMARPPAFREPKTPRSRRTLTMPEALTEILRRHQEEQAGQRLYAAETWQGIGLVCCLEDGRPVCHGVNASFARLLGRAGVPRVRFHDLRHSHASLLGALGVPLRVVSERMGHTDPGFTARVYQHVFSESERDAARKLNELLGR